MMPARTLVFRALLLSLAAPLAPLAAHAQDAACKDPFFQQEINRCAALHFENADAELATVFQSAIVRLKAQDAELKDVDPRLVGAEEALKYAQAAG